MSTAENHNKTDYNTVVADNIRAELARERWSQRKAATALGVSANWVQRRISGETPLDPNDIALFASFLHVPIASLFEPHGKKVDSIVGRLNRQTSDYKADGSGIVIDLKTRRAI